MDALYVQCTFLLLLYYACLRTFYEVYPNKLEQKEKRSKSEELKEMNMTKPIEEIVRCIVPGLQNMKFSHFLISNHPIHRDYQDED